MSKPNDMAPVPPPPVPAIRLSGVALRWSADAALPTWQPGRLDLPSTVSVRFAPAGTAR